MRFRSPESAPEKIDFEVMQFQSQSCCVMPGLIRARSVRDFAKRPHYTRSTFRLRADQGSRLAVRRQRKSIGISGTMMAGGISLVPMLVGFSTASGMIPSQELTSSGSFPSAFIDGSNSSFFPSDSCLLNSIPFLTDPLAPPVRSLRERVLPLRRRASVVPLRSGNPSGKDAGHQQVADRDRVGA